MKGRTLGFLSGAAALLFVGSLPVASLAQGNQKQNPPAKRQNKSKGSQNRATPAQPGVRPADPSPRANERARNTPSRTRDRSNVGQQRPTDKNQNKHVRKKSRSGSGQNSGDKKTGGNQGSNSGNNTGGNTGGGGNNSGTNTGGNTGGDATQGNQPAQTGNQTENNQDNSNQADQRNVAVGTVLTGLVNVNAQNINLNIYKLVDVHNVLNNSQIEVLTQKIQNSPGAQQNQEVLTNLLRRARLLNENQIVVGLLSQQREILFRNLGQQEEQDEQDQ